MHAEYYSIYYLGSTAILGKLFRPWSKICIQITYGWLTIRTFGRSLVPDIAGIL